MLAKVGNGAPRRQHNPLWLPLQGPRRSWRREAAPTLGVSLMTCTLQGGSAAGDLAPLEVCLAKRGGSALWVAACMSWHVHHMLRGTAKKQDDRHCLTM